MKSKEDIIKRIEFIKQNKDNITRRIYIYMISSLYTFLDKESLDKILSDKNVFLEGVKVWNNIPLNNKDVIDCIKIRYHIIRNCELPEVYDIVNMTVLLWVIEDKDILMKINNINIFGNYEECYERFLMIMDDIKYKYIGLEEGSVNDRN